MNVFTKTIMIEKSIKERIDYYLGTNPKSGSEDCMKSDETYTQTAVFENGYEMDIKLCGSDDDCPWTEAVLFHNGSQVCCSEPEEEFFGVWELTDGENTFIVEVVYFAAAKGRTGEYFGTIHINADIAERISMLLRGEADTANDSVTRLLESGYSREVYLPKGYKAKISFCKDGERAWAEATLSHKVDQTEVECQFKEYGNDFVGNWTLFDNGMTFNISVV